MASLAGTATREARSLADQRLKPGTGNYKRSIHATFPRPDHFELTADVPYAATLELGSRKHGIDAQHGPNLVFFWQREGVLFVGPHVNHPGNRRPRRILTDAVTIAGKKLGF
jgi:hypothetical protein